MKLMGTYLRKKREQLGYTQSQAASKLGYGSPQFISNIERGVSRVPIKSLKTFIDIYELQIEEVIEILLEEKRSQLRKALGLTD